MIAHRKIGGQPRRLSVQFGSRPEEARIKTATENKPESRSEKTRSPATLETVIEIARLMSDNKCSNVRVLDLHGVSPVCDYFILGTGTSARQMRSTVEEAAEYAAEHGMKSFGKTGTGENWIAVDLIDIVVHVFSIDGRQYYDLDNLFDAVEVSWKRDK